MHAVSASGARHVETIVNQQPRGTTTRDFYSTTDEFMQHARDQHLLIAGGGDNCVRLLPPLTLTIEEASEAMGMLERACETARAKAKAAA